MLLILCITEEHIYIFHATFFPPFLPSEKKNCSLYIFPLFGFFSILYVLRNQVRSLKAEKHVYKRIETNTLSLLFYYYSYSNVPFHAI